MVNHEKCIDCGRCTKDCVFLEKYNMNLKEYANMPDLAYNCYLCGECKRVCPVDIDGRDISLNLRQEKLKNGYNLYLKGYAPLLLEKKNYIFKNYNDVDSKIAFFPGCNFPAYYPKATKIILEKLKKELNISAIFDCCGKPIADLNMKKEKKDIEDKLNKRFKDLEIEKLIVVCPNCYYYFKSFLDIEVSMIYQEKEIMEIIVKEDIPKLEGFLFTPCPDKDKRDIFNMLEGHFKDLDEIKDIQCCGAGGCASLKEKKLTQSLQEKFTDYEEEIYVYCATCAGMINKQNRDVKHILGVLLGVEEEISEGIDTVKNRLMFSIKK